MSAESSRTEAGFWRSGRGIAAIAFAAGAIYFLLAEHRAHFISALPWIILLSCPLLHFYMHRDHSGPHEKSGSRIE